MNVTKRNLTTEPVQFDKVTQRIEKLVKMKPPLSSEYINPIVISQKVIQGIYDGVTTRELDMLSIETAAGMITTHPDYGLLAARILTSNIHKETHGRFSRCIEDLYAYVNKETGLPAPVVDEEVYRFVCRYNTLLDSAVDQSRDYTFDYFGIKTLENSYLTKLDGKTVETPQYLMMRVAIGIHTGDISKAIETYEYMSQGWFIHATPTLFNAGTPNPQLSSCFLMALKEDSIDGIYDTLKSCAIISKHAGGIGFHAHNIRAKGSYIAGTNGVSNGLVPMLRVFNSTAQYVDQGGGKRKGSFACYLEPWHADVFEWLELKRNHGAEDLRARDLFYALWIPDLFMERVQGDNEWTLMCPVECPGLPDCYGEEFDRLYLRYEKEGKGRRVVRAQELWSAIMHAQIETGTPYMLYKDACNRKSNQKNIGTIKSSNLCTEIIEYSDPDETAVCNLASLCLPRFVTEEGRVDFDMLLRVSQVVCRNLNRVIDVTYYPVPEARRSNMRHRPIGIGVQGLADMFMKLRLPFDSPEAAAVNREVFETIYYGALLASVELAELYGPYESFKGSPTSEGILQFDMWTVQPSERWDWKGLKERIVRSGLRNSLLLAPMPTASTAQIMGNTECFEPCQSNIYTRRVLKGEFVVVNKYLVEDLISLGLWNDNTKNKIIKARGSVQEIEEMPLAVRGIYKTAWELSMKTLIDMAADRGAYIDQSQSFNSFLAHPTMGKLSSMHFYGWKKGLKTGQYYLREKSASNAVQFTVEPTGGGHGEGDECLSCGS